MKRARDKHSQEVLLELGLGEVMSEELLRVGALCAERGGIAEEVVRPGVAARARVRGRGAAASLRRQRVPPRRDVVLGTTQGCGCPNEQGQVLGPGNEGGSTTLTCTGCPHAHTRSVLGARTLIPVLDVHKHLCWVSTNSPVLDVHKLTRLLEFRTLTWMVLKPCIMSHVLMALMSSLRSTYSCAQSECASSHSSTSAADSVIAPPPPLPPGGAAAAAAAAAFVAAAIAVVAFRATQGA